MKYLVGGGALYWVWQSGKLDLSLLLDHFSPAYGGFVLFFMACTVVGSFYRLHVLLRPRVPGLKLFDVFRVTEIGMFFNFVIPGGASGDLMKAYYLYRLSPTQRDSLFAGVIMDRIVGVYAMVTMAVVAMLIRPQEILKQGDVMTLFITVSAVALFLTLVFYKLVRSHGKPEGTRFLWKKIRHARMGARTFFGTFALALFIQTAAVLVMFYLARATGFHDLDLTALFIITPVGFIVSAIPIAPAGIGVGQVAFYALYKLYTGDASEVGPTIVTLYQVLMFFFSLPGLWYYLRSSRTEGNPSSSR